MNQLALYGLLVTCSLAAQQDKTQFRQKTASGIGKLDRFLTNKLGPRISVRKEIKKWADILLPKCPPEVASILNQHASEIATFFPETSTANKYRWKDEAARFRWLPDFFIKINARSRIKGVRHCKEILESLELDNSLIEVPRKCIYDNPTNQQEYVIAEFVQDNKYNCLNLEQTKQLAKFILKAGWCDAYRKNFVIKSDGKIYIIDTEISAFKNNNDKDRRRLFASYGLRNLFDSARFTPEAHEYLKKFIEYKRYSWTMSAWFEEEMKKEQKAEKVI